MAREEIKSPNYTLWFVIIGFLFGLVAVIIATWIALTMADLPLTFENVVQVQVTNPLLWFFDILPFALAIILGVLGSRERTLYEIRQQYTYAAQRYQARFQRFKEEQDRWDQERKEWETVAHHREAEIEEIQASMAESEQEFQQTESIISRGKRQWEATFDAVPDLIVITDDTDRVVRCNLATSQSLKTDFSGIIGKPLAELFLGEEAESETFPDRGAEITFPVLDGWWEVASRPLQVEEGQMGKIYLLRNVSDRVQAANDLQRQKQYYETLVKNIPVAFVTLKLDNTIVDCNPAFESLFGYQLEDIQGEPLDTLIAPSDQVEETQALTQAAAQGEMVREIAQRKRMDGSLVDVEVFGIPVILWGKQIGVLGLYHDLSGLVSMEVEEPEPVVVEMRPVNVTNIEGIGPVYAGKLAEVNIHTTGDLLESAGSRKGRQELVESTGISSNLILAWVNRADLMRLPGVGEEFSDLLEAAGVDTVKELRRRNPENLHNKILEVNESKKLVRRSPSLSEVTGWIEAAKSIEPLVTY